MRKNSQANEMREEYDFSGGVRGKYASQGGSIGSSNPTSARVEAERRLRISVQATLNTIHSSVREIQGSLSEMAERISAAIPSLQQDLERWREWDAYVDEALRLLSEQGFLERQISELLTDVEVQQLIDAAYVTECDGSLTPLPDRVVDFLYASTCSNGFRDSVKRSLSKIPGCEERILLFDEIWVAHTEAKFRLAIPASFLLVEGAMSIYLELRRGRVPGERGLGRKMEAMRKTGFDFDLFATEQSLECLASLRNSILHGDSIKYDTRQDSTKLLLFLQGLVGAIAIVQSKIEVK